MALKVEKIESELGAGTRRYLAAQSYVVVLAVYILTTLFTNAYFMADTYDYVDSIVAFAAGRYYDFWEFGHLFWRPLGWVLYVLCKPLTNFVVGGEVRLNVTLILVVISWLAGLLSVGALHGIISRFSRRAWITTLVTIGFIFSHGFLNFAQTGSSYIPGLSMLLLGLYILARRGDNVGNEFMTGALAGLALAGSVCLWFPYVLAMPGALASPLFFFGFERRRWRLILLTAIAAGVFVAVAYALVAIGALGIHTSAGFKAWMSAASHDTDIRGVTRMVFGFARSFIYLGNDGILFKRYLLSDPFNPVTFFDLLRLSLWKLALFYLFIAGLAISLLRSSLGKRMVGLLILSGAPVILFAIAFDGGAIERYLPLYPAVFIGLSGSLGSDHHMKLPKYLAIAFIAAVISTNVAAMAKPVLNRQQEVTAARISDVRKRLKPNSRLLVVTWQDELINFSRSFPFHPLNRAGNLRIGALVTPGTTLAADWRQGFASQTQETWSRGGDMWISRRALSPSPRSEWNWTEGDDKRVSWPEFQELFSQLDLGESVGGEDGFVLIPPTAKNKELLDRLVKYEGINR